MFATERRRSGGFTMIELVSTLVLLGVLVALAAPAMTGMIGRSKLDSAVAQVMGDVAYARMQAVRTAQPVTVVIQPTSYTIQRQAGVIKRVDFAREFPGLLVQASATLPVSLQFDSRGLLRSPQAQVTITLSQGSRSESMQVLPTGRIYRAY